MRLVLEVEDDDLAALIGVVRQTDGTMKRANRLQLATSVIGMARRSKVLGKLQAHENGLYTIRPIN